MDKYTRDISQGNLYKDELYIIPNEAPLTLLGSYEFPLLFIINQPLEKGINEENKVFANSILKQIPLENPVSLDTIGLINLAGKTSSLLSIIQQFKPKHVFSWGTKEVLSGITYDEFNLVYLGELGIIQCPNISEVKDTKAYKAALWQSMKTLFNI